MAGNLTLAATTVTPFFASSTAEPTPTTREAADRMKFEGSGLVGTTVESQAAGAVHRYVSKESLLTIDDYIPVVGAEVEEQEDAEKEEEKVKDVKEEEGDAGELASKNKEEQRRKKQKQNERRRNRNKNRNKKKGQR